MKRENERMMSIKTEYEENIREIENKNRHQQ